jgi:hypothetical protein
LKADSHEAISSAGKRELDEHSMAMCDDNNANGSQDKNTM